MTTTLTKLGNKYAIVIDESLLASLNFTPETPLEITASGTGLNVRPASSPEIQYFDTENNPEHRKPFERALEETNTEYESALRKLAE